MSKVYLYSRVSTDQQTLAQQERTVYEWLKTRGMEVSEVISDEGVSGGVSYADRNLGKKLIPILKEGDVIIVSEISRLGRSMFDLSKLIHNELKPRKVRLTIVSMGIDLRCDKMTAVDELLLQNFSFAAQLEKQLISERTLSALQVKRKQGIKFGAASPTYRENYNNKSQEEKDETSRKRARSKNERYLNNKNVRAFMRVLKNVFPDACKGEDFLKWKWYLIHNDGVYRARIINFLIDYNSMDGTGALFENWKFSEWIHDESRRVKMVSRILASVKKSIENYNKNN